MEDSSLYSLTMVSMSVSLSELSEVSVSYPEGLLSVSVSVLNPSFVMSIVSLGVSS